MKHFLIVYFLILFIGFKTLKADENNWHFSAEMPVAVKGAQAIVKDSLIYIIGGYSDDNYQPVNTIQIFNPQRNEWYLAEDTLQVPRYGFSAANYRQELVVFGGVANGDSSLEMWNYINPTYIYTTDENFNRQFATAQVYQNDLFVFGGHAPAYTYTDTTKLPYLVQYNVPTSSLTDFNSIVGTTYPESQNPVQQISALLGQDIYIMGGALNGVLTDIYKFNVLESNWQKVDFSLNEARAAGAAATDKENSIIIIGGYNETADALASVEKIKFNGQYIEQMNMPLLQQARSELAAAVYDTLLFVFGGQNNVGDCLTSVEKLNIDVEFTRIENDRGMIPNGLMLFPNYPNPFNPSTTIRYYLDQSGMVDLSVYNILGQQVLQLVNSTQNSGFHSIEMDASDLGSGIYFYRLFASGQVLIKRMVLVR